MIIHHCHVHQQAGMCEILDYELKVVYELVNRIVTTNCHLCMYYICAIRRHGYFITVHTVIASIGKDKLLQW